MTCYHPLTAYWTGQLNDNGKRIYTFNPSNAYRDLPPVQLPCGQCIGCRLARSLDTATRAVHESSCYSKNCFITLTVDPENIEKVFPGGGLSHEPWQKFMKRLRKRYSGVDYVDCPEGKNPDTWNYYPIRALMCGEYGSLLNRPHYHACLFNFDFSDKYLWTIRRGVHLYRSPALEELWPYGFSTIGEVTFESAAYLSRYVTKKITGEKSDEHYFNPVTGEFRHPEYIVFPYGYGLGRLWYEKFKSDCYPSDFLIAGKKNLKVKIPRYYDKIFDLTNPEEMTRLKRARRSRASEFADNNTPERLAVREEVQLARFGKLKRIIE